MSNSISGEGQQFTRRKSFTKTLHAFVLDPRVAVERMGKGLSAALVGAQFIATKWRNYSRAAEVILPQLVLSGIGLAAANVAVAWLIGIIMGTSASYGMVHSGIVLMLCVHRALVYTSPFDDIFFASLSELDTDLCVYLKARKPRVQPAEELIADCLRRLAQYVGFAVLAVLLAWRVPVIGPYAAWIVGVWSTCRSVGWELVQPIVVHLHYSHGKQELFLRDFLWEIVGFCLPVFAILFVPYVGPIVLLPWQAATAHLFQEVLYPKIRCMSM